MTSVPTALRRYRVARHPFVAASVAFLAAVVSAAALAAAGTRPASTPAGLAHVPPRSTPTAAAMVASAANGAVGGAVQQGGEGGGALGASRLGEAGGSTGGVTTVQPRWRWPLEPRPPVVRPFRAPLTTYGRGHRGLDLGAPQGARVRAVEAGVVTHAGVVGGRGTVTVTHADGVRSTYEPVRPSVARGAPVLTGDLLGILEAQDGHCGAVRCLHLGARRGAAYLDPLPLLVTGRLALLPVRRGR